MKTENWTVPRTLGQRCDSNSRTTLASNFKEDRPSLRSGASGRAQFFVVLFLATGLFGGALGCNGGGSGRSTPTTPVPVVIQPAPTLVSYPPQTDLYRVGRAIAPLTPTTAGGSVLFFNITPSLPPGLTIDLLTGVIEGTPTATALLTTYEIIAGNNSGEATTTLTFEIFPSAEVVSFAETSSTLLEGEALDLTVLLSAPANPFDLAFIIGGTAVFGTDFTMPTSPFAFPGGSTMQSLTVATVDNSMPQPPRTITIELFETSEIDVDPTRSVHTITLYDDDSPPTIYLVGGDRSFIEGSGPQLIEFAIFPPATVANSVNWIVSGSATTGLDFSVTPGPLTVPGGTTGGSIPIEIIEDNLFEGPESFTLSLLNTGGLELAAESSVEVQIIDDEQSIVVEFAETSSTAVEDEGTISLEVQLSQVTQIDLFISYAVSGTATLGDDYELPNPTPILVPANTVAAAIEIDLIDDGVLETAESIVVNLLSSPSIDLGPDSTSIVQLIDRTSGGCAVTYPESNPRFVVGSANAPLSPITNCAGTIDWSIDPPLPNGLLFSPLSGQINGIPDSVGSSTHVVTAMSATETTTVTLVIDRVLRFELEVGSGTIQYDVPTGAGSVELPVVFRENAPLPTGPEPVQGLSFGLALDAAVAFPSDFTLGADLMALNGGSGPDFTSVELYADGMGFGMVYSLLAGSFQLAGPMELVVFEIATNPTTFAGNAQGGATALTFDSTPSGVANVVVINSGVGVDAELVSGQIDVVPAP